MTKIKLLLIFSGTLIFFVFINFFTLKYETNDDPFMLYISSGALTGTPSENIFFSNILIGYLLKCLYLFDQQVSWYTWYLLGVHFISMLVILLAYFYKRKSALDCLIFMLIYTMGYLALWLVNLQFTSSSFICGFAALYFLQSRFGYRCKVWVSGTLFLLSCLIRSDVFMPLMVLGIVITVHVYLHTGRLKRHLIFLALIMSIYTGFRYWDSTVDAKENYLKYQAAASILVEQPVLITDDHLKSLGYTINDMKIFFTFFWVDQKLFAYDKLKKLGQLASVTRTGKGLFLDSLRHLWYERFAVLMFVVSFLYVPMIRDKKVKMYIVMNVLIVFAMIIYLILTSRLPKRVSTPMWGYLFLVNCMYLTEDAARQRFRLFILSMLLFLCSFKLWGVYNLSQVNKKQEKFFTRAIRQINEHPDKVFVITARGFPIQYMNVFESTGNIIKARNLIATGWNMNTPTYLELLKINKFDNVTSELITNKKARVISETQWFTKVLERYYAEHYGTAVHFERDTSVVGVMQAYRAVAL